MTALSARLAQLVEHYLDTVGVTGSSPVPRTISLLFSRSTFLAGQSADLAGIDALRVLPELPESIAQGDAVGAHLTRPGLIRLDPDIEHPDTIALTSKYHWRTIHFGQEPVGKVRREMCIWRRRTTEMLSIRPCAPNGWKLPGIFKFHADIIRDQNAPEPGHAFRLRELVRVKPRHAPLPSARRGVCRYFCHFRPLLHGQSFSSANTPTAPRAPRCAAVPIRLGFAVELDASSN